MLFNIRFLNYLKSCGFIGLILSLALFTWITYGHFYRAPFEKQFATFHDGVNLFEVPVGYPESRDEELDKFEIHLYQEVKSVADAVKHIRNNYQIKSDIDAMYAVFDFTSNRYIHRMYPVHSWITNPFYALLEIYDPLNSFNEMSTANELLRHTAVGGCGDAAVTAIEVFRALGFSAQYVSLKGHHVAEFIAGGKKWLVDANMEVIAPYSIQHIRDNLDLIEEIYGKYSVDRQQSMKKIFNRKGARFNGYSGAPRYGDYMWNLHKLIEKLKWIIPLIGIVFSLTLISIARNFKFKRISEKKKSIA